MPYYKNKQTYNIDTYKFNTSGALSSKVGFLRPGEQFSGNDLGSVIQITSGEDSSRFVYERNCELITEPPPPPPPTEEYITHYKDGVVRRFRLE